MSYDFAKIESKWQKAWDKKKIFVVKENSKKEKFYCLEMYPYPSGSGLHMGHVFNYTIGDVYARFKRMQGFNVLYPMGYDAFGLPAENAAIKAGEHPKRYTEKAIENFIKQQKLLGLSYDWDRMFKTCDAEYYKWNQFFFLKFLENGLVYRKKAPVNFCEKCNTVLANEQVHNGKCWRHEDTEVKIKYLEQWFIKTTKYAEELLNDIEKLEWPERIKIMQRNWIGKSSGTEIMFDIMNGKTKNKWPVFTTRPDTIYGVTFMVISAQHERLMDLVTEKQKKEVEKFLRKIKSVNDKNLEKEGVFTGSYAINPLTKEKIPIYAGNFVVADYGSGMVMAVPAHDQRDFEFAKKYKLPIKIVIEDKTKIIIIEESLKLEFYKKLENFAEVIKKEGLCYIYTDKVDDVFEIAKNNFVSFPWYIHSEGKIRKIMFHSNKENKIFDWSKEKEIIEAKKFGLKIGIKKEQLDFDEIREAYEGNGKLINSGKFNGIENNRAKWDITQFLEGNGLGKKSIQFKLKDWLISRQRYWGTPIPIVYCNRCGIVAVKEKQLPIKLPENVRFGKGNPLATNKKFVNLRCPKCGGQGKRETDTMDTFVDSSWYFLRYCDNKNKKQPFEKKKVRYWMPVDQYIGGAEHACMHLIYSRFFVKVLRDLNLLGVKIDEPFTNLFNQGMLHGNDGFVMSKSRGNVVNPIYIINKYGSDSLRLALISFASPEKDTNWDEKVLMGSFKFLNKISDYFNKVRIGKANPRIESKLNKIIKDVTNYIENFKYNLAVIEVRNLFNSLPEKTSRDILQKSLKLLSAFCPHISEEFWEKLGNNKFISLQKWPIADEKKINKIFEEQEKAIERLIADLNQIIKLTGKKEKIFIYILPNEKKLYDEKIIENKTGLKVKVFAVNEKTKYDPENKSKKAKPGKPGIYLE